MALNPSNSSNLEQLALKGLIVNFRQLLLLHLIIFHQLFIGHVITSRQPVDPWMDHVDTHIETKLEIAGWMVTCRRIAILVLDRK